MGVEWFRDLSITIMGFVTVAMLIFLAVIIYSLYRKIAATLSLTETLIKDVDGVVQTVEETVKSTSHHINTTMADVQDSVKQVSRGIGDTFTWIQERVKPLIPVLALIQGVSEGIRGISKIFKKDNNEKENCNEQG